MRLETIAVDPNSDGVHDCPKVTVNVDDPAGPVYFQSPQVFDADALEQSHPGAGEALIAVPREVAMQAARRLLGYDT